MLAGEDKSDTPWEPSHLYWTANVTKRAPIKRLRAVSWKNNCHNIHLMSTDTVIFSHATGDKEEPFLWPTAKIELSK